MTLEQGSFDSDRDYIGKQRLLNRIVRRIEEQALPGAPYVEQYFQSLYRRNVSVHTLKSAFTTIHDFLSFLRITEGPTSLLSSKKIWKPL